MRVELMGYEVGVVGGGIHGVSAAYHLAGRGVRTVLFERTFPAGGPTGRSSAICRAYYTNTFLAEAARDSIAMLDEFESGHHRTGGLFLHGAADVDSVHATAASLNQLGIHVDVHEPDDVAREFPGFDTTGVAVAAFERDAGYADPALTTNTMFQHAVSHGLTARLSNQVLAVDGTTIVTATERVECDRVLVAAGPWTRPLLKTIGVDLPLTVERHIVTTAAWGPASPVPFVFADIPGGYYCKPEGSELFCLGPLHAAPEADPDAFAESVSPDEQETLAAAVAARVPALVDAEARGGWASLYDVSPDWQPVIGEVAPGVYVDAGTSGHGFKLAPALGAHVADLVTGDDPDGRVAQFHPDRFAHGDRLAAGFGDAHILG
jgi:glycine/D-amino acid oxidase-like deaminating enzyme